MGKIIFVSKETFKGEARVAASPETVKKYTELGYSVVVEKGAGCASCIKDYEYKAMGAEISTSGYAAEEADIILKVRRPSQKEASVYKKGAVIVAIFDPYGAEDDIAALAKAGFTGFSMEFIPRITRAQSMDILSSQANLAGYQAIISAAEVYGRAIPMMMTAAGTVPAAKVFVMGAGVAGLQAIATARRLGAVVTANDVRPAAKGQVASLGAKFIAIENEEFRSAESDRGYAKEMSKAYQEKQAALTLEHIAKQDIVVTTALIPGRPAPRLISRKMLKNMQLGSVVVDLAVEHGGNVEGVVCGQIAEIEGIKIVGYSNILSRISATASQLYARNLYAFLESMTNKESRKLVINFEDEIVKSTLLVHGGEIMRPDLVKIHNKNHQNQQAIPLRKPNIKKGGN
ncbi:MAG: NAD(P) transhydrogenase subunit alpha [Candidatus Tokpelaia sp. JSC188]|nr:MAG: NAD(P) transhydrogenase subunit alpha [Candidatus Tokpelaia sp. JSC188]